MNENCRHLRETHSFSPEQLAAAAVCLSDLLTIYHTHTSTTTCIIVHLSPQTNLRVLTPTPLIFLQGCCPISSKCSFGLGVWLQPLGGRVMWLRDLALFGNLSSSFCPFLCFLSLFFYHFPLSFSLFPLSRTQTNNPS